jgi:hypothetical protein
MGTTIQSCRRGIPVGSFPRCPARHGETSIIFCRHGVRGVGVSRSPVGHVGAWIRTGLTDRRRATLLCWARMGASIQSSRPGIPVGSFPRCPARHGETSIISCRHVVRGVGVPRSPVGNVGAWMSTVGFIRHPNHGVEAD